MGATKTADLYEGFADPLLPFPVFLLLILAGPPVAAWVGHRLGLRDLRRGRYADARPEQIPGGTSLGAMLALLGLLLGFAFSSALGWREDRQAALVAEAAAISTAFLRADLLNEPGRSGLQRALLRYARSRPITNADVGSRESFNAYLERTLSAQAALWPATLDALDDGTTDPIRAFVAASVTDVFDAHTRRIAAGAEQVPPAAKLMLFAASVVAIFAVGNRSALQGRPLTWRTFAFSGLLSVVTLVIVDLDASLEGAITLNNDTLAAAIREMEADLEAPGR